MSPAALLKGLGFDAPARGLAKYDPNQPACPSRGWWAGASSSTRIRSPSSAAGAEARSERDEPKLCPDPDRDVPHGASERAIAYQEQISRLNNPQRPLPAGMAVSLENPLTGKNVAFDDCRESDGTMIEAKGPGYAGLVKSGFLAEKIWNEDWSLQADRQLAVAGSRDIEWFFAEPEAAEKAREWFGSDRKYQKIKRLIAELCG